jgi:hypothetical protein
MSVAVSLDVLGSAACGPEAIVLVLVAAGSAEGDTSG